MEKDSWQQYCYFLRILSECLRVTEDEFVKKAREIEKTNRNGLIKFSNPKQAFMGFKILSQKLQDNSLDWEILDLANMAVHTTSSKNALSDIEAGYFRPAKEFENKNSSTSHHQKT